MYVFNATVPLVCGHQPLFEGTELHFKLVEPGNGGCAVKNRTGAIAPAMELTS